MVVDVQKKLRLALGSVKDHASIGKAMMYNSSSDGLSGIEIAVVRATGHDNNPIDDKHMHEILFLVSNTPASSVPFLAERISHRLYKTRDRSVALKTLMLVHRLLRGGDRYFEEDLRKSHLSGHLQFNNTARCRWNNSNSSSSNPSSIIIISFLHNYAAFLQERMGWLINQAGKLEPIMFHQVMEFRFYQDKSIEMVFLRLPKCQLFLDRVLNFSTLLVDISISPSHHDHHRLTRAAMTNILKESFQVYVTFCEGVATLLDSFFDFKNPAARVLALDLLKKASLQSYQLFHFFENCKKIIGFKNLDYPTVQIITQDHVLAMEHFLISTSTSSNSCCKTILSHHNGSIDDTRHGVPHQITKQTDATLSSCRLETKISKVWVVFDEQESQNSRFSVGVLDHHSSTIVNAPLAQPRVRECMEELETTQHTETL